MHRVKTFAFPSIVLALAVSLSSCSMSDERENPVREDSASRTDTDARLDWSSSTRLDDVSYDPSKNKKLTAEGHLAAAKKAFEGGDFDTSIRAATNAIRLNPQMAEAYTWRGKAYYASSSGDQKAALMDLQKAISIDPKVEGGYEYLAMIYDSQKEYDKALAALNRAIEADPSDRDLHNSRATVLLTLGESERALQDQSEYIRLGPDKPSGYMKRGVLLEKLGRYDLALSDYSRAITLQPASDILVTGQSFKTRASLLSRLGRHKESIADLSKAIGLDDSDDDALRTRGDEYFALGHLEKAIADYTRAIELSPQYARASFEARSKAYRALGKFELAEKDKKEAGLLRKGPAEKPIYHSQH